MIVALNPDELGASQKPDRHRPATYLAAPPPIVPWRPASAPPALVRREAGGARQGRTASGLAAGGRNGARRSSRRPFGP